jgi:hypothetical protein
MLRPYNRKEKAPSFRPGPSHFWGTARAIDGLLLTWFSEKWQAKNKKEGMSRQS